MKKLLFLFIIPLVSCSNSDMSSDAQEICGVMEQTLVALEPSNEANSEELTSLKSKSKELIKKVDAIMSKYDKDEFQSYLLENCEPAKVYNHIDVSFLDVLYSL